MTDIEQQILDRIYRAHDQLAPWQFAHYIERYDGPAGWTPLIFTADSEVTARGWHATDGRPGDGLRRSRVLRRAVSPWEIR